MSKKAVRVFRKMEGVNSAWVLDREHFCVSNAEARRLERGLKVKYRLTNVTTPGDEPVVYYMVETVDVEGEET